MDRSVEAHLVFRYEISYLYHAQFVDRFLNTTCSFNAIPYTPCPSLDFSDPNRCRTPDDVRSEALKSEYQISSLSLSKSAQVDP